MIEGTVIEEEIPDALLTDKLYSPRNKDVLPIKTVIEKADNFLRGQFGKDFKLYLFGVNLARLERPNGVLWCWHVVYHYPQTDEKNNDKFLKITLSLEGKPLMKVTKANE